MVWYGMDEVGQLGGRPRRLPRASAAVDRRQQVAHLLDGVPNRLQHAWLRLLQRLLPEQRGHVGLVLHAAHTARRGRQTNIWVE